MMDWIDRYVAEVERYLPTTTREDVGEELRSLLEARVEGKEDELGHAVSEQDVFAMLKELGHPMRFASSYGDGEGLISPELFPFYKLVIRYFLITLFAVYCGYLMWMNLAEATVTFPGYRFGAVFDFGLTWIALCTIVFAIVDHRIRTTSFFDCWDPKSLPHIRTKREPLSGSIFVAVLTIAWFAILSMVPMEHSFEVLVGEAGNLFLTFILWLKIQAVMTIPVYIWLMFQPNWTIPKRLIIVTSDALVIIGAMLCLSMDPAPLLTQFPDTSASLHELNAGITILLWIWIGGLATDAGTHLWKMFR